MIFRTFLKSEFINAYMGVRAYVRIAIQAVDEYVLLTNTYLKKSPAILNNISYLLLIMANYN